MIDATLASVIINNYNYARFLREAIDSALNQTYPRTEVIVVDDGSTDGSREVIADYGRRIVPVYKENGGQNSALNAGFAISRGDAILFLDSDDSLAPTAVEVAMALLCKPGVVKVHWPWVEWDESSREASRVWWKPLPECDMRDLVLRDGPDAIAPYLPSGNAYTRKFLESVFPLPDVQRAEGNGTQGKTHWVARPGPDLYLATLAALSGRIEQVTEPQARYRLHGQNGYQSLKFEDRLNFDRELLDYVSCAAVQHCHKLRISADSERWTANSWAYRVQRAARDIVALVPPGESFILVDEDQWKTDAFLAGRRRILFPEREGRFWGKPEDDAAAIQELKRLRTSGADFVVFVWSTFWWLDYYSGMNRYLRTTFSCVREDERLVAFDMRKERLA